MILKKILKMIVIDTYQELVDELEYKTDSVHYYIFAKRLLKKMNESLKKNELVKK